jgi:serine/threonine protein kinase
MKFSGLQGFCKMLYFGYEGSFTVLVMELLGPSIEELFVFCEQKFKLLTVMWIAQELLDRIKVLHNSNFLHRDLKTENLCIGLGKRSWTVYLIDFGLAKRFRCPKTGKHVQHSKKKCVTGTLRFCSTNATAKME